MQISKLLHTFASSIHSSWRLNVRKDIYSRTSPYVANLHPAGAYEGVLFYNMTEIDENRGTAPKGGDMGLNDYQQAALSTAIYPHDHEISYLALALCGEAGEVADKIKKIIRDKDGKLYQPDTRAIADELGDALWYASNLAHVLGYKLSDIARLNIEKINGRLERGTLHGEGDNR